MIRINWNGSRFLGQPCASLDALLELLTLERVTVDILRIGVQTRDGRVYSGNFERISHGFSVTTDEPETERRIIDAIETSRKLPSYDSAELDGLHPISDRVLELMRDGLENDDR